MPNAIKTQEALFRLLVKERDIPDADLSGIEIISSSNPEGIMAKIIPEYTEESVREISSDDLMYRKSAFLKNGNTEMINLMDAEIARRVTDPEVNERDKKIANYAEKLKDMDIDQLFAALGRMIRQEAAEISYTADAHDCRVQVTMIQDQIRSLIR